MATLIINNITTQPQFPTYQHAFKFTKDEFATIDLDKHQNIDAYEIGEFVYWNVQAVTITNDIEYSIEFLKRYASWHSDVKINVESDVDLSHVFAVVQERYFELIKQLKRKAKEKENNGDLHSFA